MRKQITPEQYSWIGMRERCSNDKNPMYKKYYIDKGITVCERWDTFDNFLADMGPRPIGTTLDRRESSKGYDPSNCRWATVLEQARNRSNVKFLTFSGETRPVVEWAEITGIKAPTIHARLKAGRSVEEALTAGMRVFKRKLPRSTKYLDFNGQKKTMKEWAREIGVSRPGLWHRLNGGLTLEEALSRPSQRGRYEW